jgi:hypothetical protein
MGQIEGPPKRFRIIRQGPCAIKQITEILQNGIVTQKTKFTKFHWYKNFILKVRVKKTSTAQIFNVT